MYPKYDDYQAKTSREIPVVTLTPVGDNTRVRTSSAVPPPSSLARMVRRVCAPHTPIFVFGSCGNSVVLVDEACPAPLIPIACVLVARLEGVGCANSISAVVRRSNGLFQREPSLRTHRIGSGPNAAEERV